MATANPSEPARPRGDTAKTYTDPADEPRSTETQAAVDRWLHGLPTNPDGSVKQ